MRKYLNIFWVLLAAVIILNELFIISEFQSFNQIKWGTWLLVAIWMSIGIKNIYSFYYKQFNLHQK